MIKKLKYILFLFVCFFLYKNAYALSLSGQVPIYLALGNQNVYPEYDSGYSESHNHYFGGINSRDEYFTFAAGGMNNGGYYQVIKKFTFNLTASENLQSGVNYKIKFSINNGGYVTYTDFYGWRWTPNTNIYNCRNGNNYANNASACSTSWTKPGNDQYYSDLIVYFTPSENTNKISFDIGTISGSQNFVCWNRLGDVQRINIYFTSIEVYSAGGGSGSTDLTATNDKIDDVKDSVDDVKDSVDDLTDALTDDSSLTTNELSDFFDDIPLITSGPISDLMLLPTFILNAIINRSSTSCPAGSYFSIDLPYVDGGFEFHCWTLSDYLDSGTLNTITWILYVVMFYNIAMLVISCWETWTNLSTDFASMYQPKHADIGYKPKHGGGN